jgi:hypothetical protein
MTTHDEQTTASTVHTDPQADAAPAEDERLTAADESSEVGPESSQIENEPSSEPSTERSLLADDDSSGLRARWDDVQAAFVDNPKECVQKADTLVAEAVEKLTTGFSDARSRLEEQWARGETASTEDLRIALKRYRDFFQRLLSV